MQVDARAGHLLLAQAGASALRPPGATAQTQGSTHMYALRYTLAHAFGAEAPVLLQELLLDLGVWEQVYAAGEEA